MRTKIALVVVAISMSVGTAEASMFKFKRFTTWNSVRTNMLFRQHGLAALNPQPLPPGPPPELFRRRF